MMNLRIGVIALVAALALAAAGCGGDDETTAEPLTKEEFITQADEICTEGNEELATEEQPDPENLDAFITDTLAPNLQEQHDGIAALGVPEGDEEEIESLLDNLQEGIDALEEDPNTLTEGGPFVEVNRQATEYGLQVCGS
jgi:hypothetical protein